MKNLYLIIIMLFCLSELVAQTKFQVNSSANISGLYKLGRSNASCGFPWWVAKNQLWADPLLDEIVLVRLNDTVTGAGLYYDLSKDGGINWDVDYGYPYSYNLVIGNPNIPMAGIANPSGIINADSSYVTYAVSGGNALSSTCGQSQVSSGLSLNYTNSTVNRLLYSDYFITRQGIIWQVAGEYSGNDYTGTIVIKKGVWNSNTQSYSYTDQLLSAPVIFGPGTPAYLSSSIAFSSDGLTGYIVMSGNEGTYPVAAYYPVVYKTTDGGNTWNPPVAINLSGIDALLNLGTTIFTLVYRHDIVVNANGEVHIACNVFKGNNNWTGSGFNGEYGIFDIYSSGNQWKARLLRAPHNYIAEIGGFQGMLQQTNRPQISIDSSGSKMIFTWAETDTNYFGSTSGNMFPDVYMKGYDINTGLCTPLQNATAGTIGFGLCLFHQASYYSLYSVDDLNVPVVICHLDDQNQGAYSPVTFLYLEDNMVPLSSFTDSCLEITLNSSFGLSGISRTESCLTKVSARRNGITFMSGNSVLNSEAELHVMSVAGQEIFSGRLSESLFTISGDIKPGIYFYSLVSKSGSVCSGKFLVE